MGSTTSHSNLPGWLTGAQFEVLRTVIEVLAAGRTPYVASGGLAGNLHGSSWPLHDIDLDVPAAALEPLARRFAGGLQWGPARYADDEFDLALLRLRLDGVEVDVAAAESVVLRTPAGERVARPTDLTRAEHRAVGGLDVRVLPLDDLLDYKRLIGREADVRALEALGERR